MKQTTIVILLVVLAAIGLGIYWKVSSDKKAAASAAADPAHPDTKPSNTTSAPTGSIRFSADVPIMPDNTKAAL